MNTMTIPGYEKLADVLRRAYDQASKGKGKERHASDGVPFEDQPMSSINRTLGGIDGFLYQAAKKAGESKRLPAGRAQAELLGAINYLAGAVIALDTWAADTLPGAAPADCGCQLVCGGGAGAPGCKGLPTLEQAAWGEKKRTFIVDGAEFEAVPRGEKHQCADCHFALESLGDCVSVVRLAAAAGIPACGAANVFYARVQR